MAASFSETYGNMMLDYLSGSVINSGTGTNATIEFLNASNDVLCVVSFNSTPFNSASSKQITLNTTSPVTGTVTQDGTPTSARIKNKSGVVVRSGYTVGTSGTDFVFSSVSWTKDSVVRIDSFTISIT